MPLHICPHPSQLNRHLIILCYISYSVLHILSFCATYLITLCYVSYHSVLHILSLCYIPYHCYISYHSVLHIVTYSGFSIHDATLLHSKSQHTTVKHSRKLLEHMYTSDLYGRGTLTPIEFFQQHLLWQSSNTHFHSYSHKASKHTRSIRRQAIGPLAHHNGTSAQSPSLACHLPAPTIECLHHPLYRLTCFSHCFPDTTARLSSNNSETTLSKSIEVRSQQYRCYRTQLQLGYIVE
jgi:hypothetical protein